MFTHHKVATVLMASVFDDLTRRLGWSSEQVFGHRSAAAPPADVIRFAHGIPTQLPHAPSFRAVHLIRDPREVLVSGYLYHRHTAEAWCTHVPPTSLPDVIGYPLVPHELASRDRESQVAYLRRLDGRSYQQRLLASDATTGLLFELENYASWTIDEMASWATLRDERVLTLRLEYVMASHEEAFERIARHLRLRWYERLVLARVARRHDLARKTERELASMEHVHQPEPDRWKRYLNGAVLDRLDELCGESIRLLGYSLGHSVRHHRCQVGEPGDLDDAAPDQQLVEE